MSNKKAGTAHRSSHVRHRRPAREDPQRRARRPFRRGQDDPGRGVAGRDRRDRPRRHDRRRHHGQRPRPGRGRAAALGRAVGVPAALHRRHGEREQLDEVIVNLLDTPGYPDFTGELRAGLRAADAALFVVSAADDIDPITVSLWEECAALGTPRAVVISRLDAPRADYAAHARRVPAACSAAPDGQDVLPLYVPVGGAAGARRAAPHGLVGLLSRTGLDYAAGYPPKESADARRPGRPRHRARRADRGDHQQQRGRDAARPLPRTARRSARGAGRRPRDRRRARHVLPGAAGVRGDRAGAGRAARGARRRRSRPRSSWTRPRSMALYGGPTPDAHLRPGRPAAGRGRAHVRRPVPGPAVDPADLLRDAHPGDRGAHLRARRRRARPPRPRRRRAGRARSSRRSGATLRPIERAVAGDICAIGRLGTAETGDTLSAKAAPLLIEPWDMPEPQLPIAVEAATRADEDALAKALGRLTAGDPTVRVERHPDTGQLVLWCLGEAHADVVLERLRATGAHVETVPLRIALRETFTAEAQRARPAGQAVRRPRAVRGVRRRSSTPLPRGSGVEFAEKVVGGAVPSQFIGSVEKGVRAQLEQGLDQRPHPDRGRAGHPGRRQVAQRRLLRRGVPDRRRARGEGRRAAGRAGPARADRRRRHHRAGRARRAR